MNFRISKWTDTWNNKGAWSNSYHFYVWPQSLSSTPSTFTRKINKKCWLHRRKRNKISLILRHNRHCSNLSKWWLCMHNSLLWNLQMLHWQGWKSLEENIKRTSSSCIRNGRCNLMIIWTLCKQSCKLLPHHVMSPTSFNDWRIIESVVKKVYKQTCYELSLT